MQTIEFNELQTSGWLNNLFIDYKRINTSDINAVLKITENLKCQICNKREIKKEKIHIDDKGGEKDKGGEREKDERNIPLLQNEKSWDIKNEYILIFNRI